MKQWLNKASQMSEMKVEAQIKTSKAFMQILFKFFYPLRDGK